MTRGSRWRDRPTAKLEQPKIAPVEGSGDSSVSLGEYLWEVQVTAVPALPLTPGDESRKFVQGGAGSWLPRFRASGGTGLARVLRPCWLATTPRQTVVRSLDELPYGNGEKASPRCSRSAFHPESPEPNEAE